MLTDIRLPTSLPLPRFPPPPNPASGASLGDATENRIGECRDKAGHGRRELAELVCAQLWPQTESTGAAMAESLPEVISGPDRSVDALEELKNDCISIWKKMEESQSILTCQKMKTFIGLDPKLSLLMMKCKALTTEYCQYEQRSPEISSIKPDVLLTLGRDELQGIKKSLEIMLVAVKSKNNQLEEDMKREKQWCEEQKMLLKEIEKKAVTQTSESFTTRGVKELQKEINKVKLRVTQLSSTLVAFVKEHFPLPEEHGRAKNKQRMSRKEPAVKLVTLQEIVETLINKLLNTPHDPYVRITESFWPPYIEFLLRHGIVLRHPEDPSRMRLEAFHM